MAANFPIVIAGEALIDLISTNYADTLADAESFVPTPGGSAANLAVNMARLGNEVALVAGIGNDGWGTMLLRHFADSGVNVDSISVIDLLPTTLVTVSRSRHTPDFQVFRGADTCLFETTAALPETAPRLFHTTCFALSAQPAQARILEAGHAFAKKGTTLSMDTNYSPQMWPNRAEALQIIKDWCATGSLIKCSADDWGRLGGDENEPQKAIDFFLGAGASQVCLTLGAKGCIVATADLRTSLSALPLSEVKDATGAGDAFWSGYLSAWLDNKTPDVCALAGLRTAKEKLGHIGPLPKGWPKSALYHE